MRPNARAAGPRLGRDVQAAIRASKAGDWQLMDDGRLLRLLHRLLLRLLLLVPDQQPRASDEIGPDQLPSTPSRTVPIFSRGQLGVAEPERSVDQPADVERQADLQVRRAGRAAAPRGPASGGAR